LKANKKNIIIFYICLSNFIR